MMFAMTTRTLVYSAPAFAVMAAVSIAAPARAADSDTQSKVIHYRDLDLTTDAGETTLKQRIARAAANICGPADGRTLEDRARLDACRDNAIASASPQMNAVIASARSSDHRYAVNNGAVAMLGR
jgi:UrcA family protein